MDFNEQLSAVRWKRVGVAITAGVAVFLVASYGYDAWRRRNGWCVRFYPDGRQQIFYGTDCQKPIN